MAYGPAGHFRRDRTAALWLRMLVFDGILRITEKGSADTMKATRYTYLYPLDEDKDEELEG
jgi:hypothetical protein